MYVNGKGKHFIKMSRTGLSEDRCDENFGTQEQCTEKYHENYYGFVTNSDDSDRPLLPIEESSFAKKSLIMWFDELCLKDLRSSLLCW